MEPLPDAPAIPPKQRPVQDMRVHIAGLVEPARRRMLRTLLEEKTKSELIDVMFEMTHLPDLLDFFREDLERHHLQI